MRLVYMTKDVYKDCGLPKKMPEQYKELDNLLGLNAVNQQIQPK